MNVMLVECYYPNRQVDSTNSNFLYSIQGGERARDEMCLASQLYYPRIPLDGCVTIPHCLLHTCLSLSSISRKFDPHNNMYINIILHGFQLIGQVNVVRSSKALVRGNEDGIRAVLDQVDWTPNVIQDLQDSVLSSNGIYFCYMNNEVSITATSIYTL